MSITLQDILEQEFHVRFRGFDKDEVDAFLEEVAESFYKLTEENTLLNEKILALQQDLEAAGSLTPQGQVELRAELGNILEEIKQDTATIGVELAALKQDRQTFDSLEKNLRASIASIEEAASEMKPQGQLDIPADLADTLKEFKQNSEAIAAELAALKDDRQAFDSLKKSLEEVIGSAKEEAASSMTLRGQAGIPGDLGKALEDFKLGTETIGAELAALKQEVGSIAGIRGEIKGELQELLTFRFAELDAKLSAFSDKAVHAAPKPEAAPPAPEKKEKLLAARIVEEPEGFEEDTRLPDYREEADGASGTDDLEFLNEDDILDVDKLRNIFQSVLDDGISDGHYGREGDDTAADLLFLEEILIEDDHEPEVTFSLDEKETDKKRKRSS